MINLSPAPAPAPVAGFRTLRVATWNCTGSDATNKIEQIAMLVWGTPPNRAFNDLVVIQEFSKQPRNQAEVTALEQALKKNGWKSYHSPDEGPSSSSNRSYFVVWNPKILKKDNGPTFIDILPLPTAAPQRAPGKRPIKPVRRLDPIADTSNRPLAMRFTNRQVPTVPVFAYTWHVTPFEAAARVREWPSGKALNLVMVRFNALRQILAFTDRSRVVTETQAAVMGQGLLIVAGDLNANKGAITSARGGLSIPFPPALGYKIASGGSGKPQAKRAKFDIDHIIACCGQNAVVGGTQPGVKIGDHCPLAAIIAF